MYSSNSRFLVNSVQIIDCYGKPKVRTFFIITEPIDEKMLETIPPFLQFNVNRNKDRPSGRYRLYIPFLMFILYQCQLRKKLNYNLSLIRYFILGNCYLEIKIF